MPSRALTSPAPLVLVFPNYAGLKQFDIDQASGLLHAPMVRMG